LTGHIQEALAGTVDAGTDCQCIPQGDGESPPSPNRSNGRPRRDRSPVGRSAAPSYDSNATENLAARLNDEDAAPLANRDIGDLAVLARLMHVFAPRNDRDV